MPQGGNTCWCFTIMKVPKSWGCLLDTRDGLKELGFRLWIRGMGDSPAQFGRAASLEGEQEAFASRDLC